MHKKNTSKDCDKRDNNNNNNNNNNNDDDVKGLNPGVISKVGEFDRPGELSPE